MKGLKSLLAISTLALCTFASAQTIEMDVKGLVCDLCVKNVEASLRKFPGTGDVYVDLQKQFVAVKVTEGRKIEDDELRSAITQAGFELVAIRHTDATMEQIRSRVASGK